MRDLNRNVLMETIRFLTTIVEHKDSNKMNEYNISLMFAPNIFRTISGKDSMVFEHIERMQIHTNNMIELIKNFEYIFAEWIPGNEMLETKEECFDMGVEEN